MLRSRDVVRSLFNQPSTSDLTLVINDFEFHAHCSVVGECSEMVAAMLRSTFVEHSEAKTILRINPPHFFLPSFTDCDRDERELNMESLFELYLLIIYGLKNPVALTVKELCSVAVLSNFMLSSKLALVCERIIVQNLWLSQDSWQEAFQFANRHGFVLLTKCILDYAAMIVHRNDCIEDLLRLDPCDILHILRDMSLNAREQFRLVVCYLAYASSGSTTVLEQFDRLWNGDDSDATAITIEGDDNIDFLRKATKILAPCWQERDLLCRIKSTADRLVMKTTAGTLMKDNFLYSAILDQVMILMRVSADASNSQSSISTRFNKEPHRNTIV